MKAKYLLTIFFLVLISSFIFTSFILTEVVYARGPTEDDQTAEQGSTADSSQSEGLPNPLGTGNVDPRAIIGNIIKAILGIVGSLALAVFIFGGFTWVTSGGNEEKIKKGKDMIVWASLGLAVIFASYALVRFVIEAVTTGGG